MKKEVFTCISSSDHLSLDGFSIIPKGEIKGIVQICHGMAEHKERYELFMIFLAENGYGSYIHDHRGHGKSCKSRDDLGYFYEENAKAIISDVYDVTQLIQQRFPNVPIVLFGHSMGSLVVRQYLKRYDDQIQALIVCGSPSENKMAKVALKLVHILEKKYGDHHRSQLIQNMAFGSFDKKFKEKQENSWLSANPENVARYNACEDDGYIFTLNGFKNLFTMMYEVYQPTGYQKKHLDIPIFFIAGEEDPVIVSKKNWLAAQDVLRQQGYTHIENHLYTGMRHEILNEIECQKVYEDILQFIQRNRITK